MLRPTAVKIKAVPDYRLIVVFDNGEEKIFDVKPYIHGEWYSELKDINYFSLSPYNGSGESVIFDDESKSLKINNLGTSYIEIISDVPTKINISKIVLYV